MKRSVAAGGERFEYVLIRSRRQDVLLKALPGGETRVYAPSWARIRDIDELVRDRAGELKRLHAELEHALERSRLDHPMAEGSRVCVEGKGYFLRRLRGARVSLELSGDLCVLTLPEPEDEERVREALKRALSRRALRRVRERLEYYAPRLDVEFGRVAIRDQRTRWGSCSSNRNLNFNWKLIMAPPEALDYVVVHELCHLIEFNHSPRFWKLVEGQLPEYEYWKRWFKEHGGELGVGAVATGNS